jgi:FkbM family methyltransferase
MGGLDFFVRIYASNGELTIFDVGAHYGETASEFIRLFPRSHVFAFEPDEKNWSHLKQHYGDEPRIELCHVAVGQKDGRTILYRNNYDATHSVLRINTREINRWADASDVREDGAEEVEQLTLDTFCIMQGITNIDILKLDIQGGELMALQGIKDNLSKQAVRAIFCEVEFRELYENQPLFWNITAYLMSFGYHFLNLVSRKVSEMGVLSWADAIYVNDQLWQDIASKHSAGKLIS